MTLFRVYDRRCNQCLFGEDKVVSDARRRDIIQGCLQQDAYFICHKATIRGEKVCCRGFYDTLGIQINLVRIAQRLGMVEEVSHQPGEEEVKRHPLIQRPVELGTPSDLLAEVVATFLTAQGVIDIGALPLAIQLLCALDDYAQDLDLDRCAAGLKVPQETVDLYRKMAQNPKENRARQQKAADVSSA